jgi:hypothetical protein
MPDSLPLVADSNQEMDQLEMDVRELFKKYEAVPMYTFYLGRKLKLELYEIQGKGAIHYVQSAKENGQFRYLNQPADASLVFIGFDEKSAFYSTMKLDFDYVLDTYRLQ